MHLRLSTALSSSLVAASALCGAQAQTTLISDSFETDSSADYTVVDDGGIDGVADFTFDYVAAGIPLAPRSAPGDTTGLRFTVNTSGMIQDARTAFHNTAVMAGRYRMTADVFISFAGSSGTTEHAHVGVGGDGATFNQLFSPISGSGAFIAFDGDGGSGSDYRWFRDADNTPLGDDDSTTLPNSHPSYLGNGSNNSGSFFQSLFPSPPSTVAGSPGNIWTTVTVDVDNTVGQISFFFDGVLTFRGLFAGSMNGQVSLGLADVFTSVAGPDIFTVFDNLLVESLDPIGLAYCTVVTNSTGVGARLLASGSAAETVNDLSLFALDMPTDTFGVFLASDQIDFVMNPGGSAGNLCLGPNFGRGVGGQIFNTGPAGTFQTAADLTAIPTATGSTAVVAGETVYFQAWFRDRVMGSNTSNFSNGLLVIVE